MTDPRRQRQAVWLILVGLDFRSDFGHFTSLGKVGQSLTIGGRGRPQQRATGYPPRCVECRSGRSGQVYAEKRHGRRIDGTQLFLVFAKVVG